MDKAELSQILKEAFRLYGYELAQTFNVPTAFEPLLTGEDAVVSIHLNRNNTITITEYKTDEICKEELKACRKTVKEQAVQIEALQTTIAELESQATTEETAVATTVEPLSEPEPKPRKRRKRS